MKRGWGAKAVKVAAAKVATVWVVAVAVAVARFRRSVSMTILARRTPAYWARASMALGMMTMTVTLRFCAAVVIAMI